MSEKTLWVQFDVDAWEQRELVNLYTTLDTEIEHNVALVPKDIEPLSEDAVRELVYSLIDVVEGDTDE